MDTSTITTWLNTKLWEAIAFLKVFALEHLNIILLLVVAYIAWRSITLWWGTRQRGTRDGQRLYDNRQRAHIHRRAGGRCEHAYLRTFRCWRKSREADHIIPHAKGGRTVVANGQALCKQHNRAKSDKMPSKLYIVSLESRRRGYFPKGESVRVGQGGSF